MAKVTGSRHVIEAVILAWEDAQLSDLFKLNRALANRNSEKDVLHERDAEPLTPFPYCVWSQAQGNRAEHMSYSDESSRRTANTFWQFKVHAQTKVLAADLADKIMETFDTKRLCLPTTEGDGSGLVMRHLNEFHTPMGDDEYLWNINYEIIWDAVTNA